ncbi:MAG: hypothetical protein IPL77_11370 [Flavobacteriales bacterium]|nr:hypothetical protein [Flavobacteriales bacterium]
MSTYNGSFPSAAACGCTAVWGWSPARKSFWSAGGITYDANQTSGTCAHRNVFQRPDTNFRRQGRREEGWLPGKEPAPFTAPAYPAEAARCAERLAAQFTRSSTADRGWTRAEFASKVLADDEVMVAARGQKWAVGEGINPGQIAQGVWVTTHRGERRVLILADLDNPYSGYVRVTVLRRCGDVRTSLHCTECGAGEGALHRGGEECPGLRKMRHNAGLRIEPPGASAIGHVKETRLRPYKSELAVMMVDDMSEPP